MLLNWLSQIGAVTKFGLLSIPQRRGSVAAALFGIAGVVGVLVGVLSMAAGFKHAMAASGSPDSAIVLRNGADNEMSSGLEKDETRVIAEGPGVARGPKGPLASAELFVIIDLPMKSSGTDANVPFRGVEPAASDVREGFKIVQGRMFEAGKNELIAGVGAAAEFAGLEVGHKLKIGKNEWEVVGLFSARGGTAESEIWTEASVLQAAYNRGNSFQSVYVKLVSPAAFPSFKDTLTSDPRLSVMPVRQPEYYEEQSRLLTQVIQILGTLVASFMAVGAIFGALNTMYNSVSARIREIATLRALGFGRAAIVVSVMLEALAVALVGGVIGAAFAYVAFNGFHTSTVNWQSFSQVTFAFLVTPQLLMRGIIWATFIGLIGGLLPALRAARLPIASALREL